jgi:endoribonuclease LACTB2
MNIVNVGYDSTNYYVIGQGRARLMVDCGWPGTLPKLLANLKRMDISLRDIPYLLATHYHPDHAGLAQELQNQGVRLVVLDTQVAAVPLLKKYMKPEHRYLDIQLNDALQLAPSATRAFLQKIRLAGEVIPTPGHSDDSISLVLDSGEAFTGDLLRPQMAPEEIQGTVQRSWQAIQALHAAKIFPGHGPQQDAQLFI